MGIANKKTLILVFLSLIGLIIFFNSVFIFPAFYAEAINERSLTFLILLASFFSASTIFFLYVYILSNTNKESNLNKKFPRLESLNHPLLLRLSVEAPGSYHHSINVANLSHQAAKSIGANAALVRIASYYHDAGKIIHPEVYIENQTKVRSKSQNLSEFRKISRIITRHTSIGKKIAEENNLPEEIIQIISEHHGTTMAKFLYDESRLLGKIDIKEFRYPGPKPQTIESVIVMIADCVEAATKGTRELNKKNISQIVDSVIEEKISEKQFSNVAISPNSLQRIRNSLIKTLSLMYHQRISTE